MDCSFLRLRGVLPFSFVELPRNTLRANPTNIHSKTLRSRRHEQSIPPIMKNERYKLGNPTETRTIQSRTQITIQHSELGINDLHRIQLPISPQTRGSLHFPAAADNPGVRRWNPVNHASVVPWRRGAPQSPSPSSFGAPQGNNEIYTYDVVFSPGEDRTETISQTQFPSENAAEKPRFVQGA